MADLDYRAIVQAIKDKTGETQGEPAARFGGFAAEGFAAGWRETLLSYIMRQSLTALCEI